MEFLGQPPQQVDEPATAVAALRQRVLEHLIAAAERLADGDGDAVALQPVDRRPAGFLQLSVWTACCLSVWQRAQSRDEAISRDDALPIDSRHRVARTDLKPFYERCITVTLYRYRSDMDSFEPIASVPPSRASAVPAINATPGSGLLWHVARLAGTYRTWNIHLDVRSRLASDDIRRGLWEAVYACVDVPPVRYIVVLSAPASGLLDAVAEQFPGWAKQLAVLAPPAAPADQRLEIELHRADLTASLLEALVSQDAGFDSIGIMLAAIRKGKPGKHGRNPWHWQLTGLGTQLPQLPRPAYAATRIARAITKRVMLGSMSSAWRSAIDEQITEWRREPPRDKRGKMRPSGIPGVAGYEADLHRLPVWITTTDGRRATAVFRVSNRGPIKDVQQPRFQIAHELSRVLAEVMEEWRRRLRGTVTRTRLQWDFSEALLQLAAEHLAGRAGTGQEFTELGRSVDLLCDLIAGIDLTRAPSISERLQTAAACIDRAHGCLHDTAMIVPWVYRAGYRVADARTWARPARDRAGTRRGRAAQPGRGHADRAEPAAMTGSGPAVFVVHEATGWHLKLVSELREPGDDAIAQLARVAASRSYLVPLQRLLSAIRASRPEVQRVAWCDNTTVELSDKNGCQETLALDLPLANVERCRTLNLYHRDGMLFSIHHNIEDSQAFMERFGILKASWENAERWCAISAELCAIVVAWEPTGEDDGLPVGLALPEAGMALRQHLQGTYQLRNREIVTHGDDPPISPLSCDITQAILRHGRYSDGFRKTWDAHLSARSAGGASQARWKTWAEQHVHSYPEVRAFAGEYLHNLLAPRHDGEDFPEGLTPLARQLHVLPLKVGTDTYLLHLYTDWEARPSDQAGLRAALFEHVHGVVKQLNEGSQHGGTASRTVFSTEPCFTRALRRDSGDWHQAAVDRTPELTKPQREFDFVLHCYRPDEWGSLWLRGEARERRLGPDVTRVLVEAALKPGGFRVDDKDRKAHDRDRKNLGNLKKILGFARTMRKWTAEPGTSERGQHYVKSSTFSGSFEIVLATTWFNELRLPRSGSPVAEASRAAG